MSSSDGEASLKPWQQARLLMRQQADAQLEHDEEEAERESQEFMQTPAPAVKMKEQPALKSALHRHHQEQEAEADTHPHIHFDQDVVMVSSDGHQENGSLRPERLDDISTVKKYANKKAKKKRKVKMKGSAHASMESFLQSMEQAKSTSTSTSTPTSAAIPSDDTVHEGVQFLTKGKSADSMSGDRSAYLANDFFSSPGDDHTEDTQKPVVPKNTKKVVSPNLSQAPTPEEMAQWDPELFAALSSGGRVKRKKGKSKGKSVLQALASPAVTSTKPASKEPASTPTTTTTTTTTTHSATDTDIEEAGSNEPTPPNVNDGTTEGGAQLDEVLQRLEVLEGKLSKELLLMSDVGQDCMLLKAQVRKMRSDVSAGFTGVGEEVDDVKEAQLELLQGMDALREAVDSISNSVQDMPECVAQHLPAPPSTTEQLQSLQDEMKQLHDSFSTLNDTVSAMQQHLQSSPAPSPSPLQSHSHSQPSSSSWREELRRSLVLVGVSVVMGCIVGVSWMR